MPPLFFDTLKVLFKLPIVILMKGDWRMGKTDTSLLVAHLALEWGLVDRVGSNIFTFNNPKVEHIVRSSKLKSWLHMDKSVKLYILDEGLKHAYRRKAMSKKNVEIITEILPELSKGHGRVIICSQIEKLDSDILHPAFCRARWFKKSKKVMKCYSKHHPPRTFTGLPRSPIRFDPDVLAPFIIDKEMSKGMNLEARGKLYEVIGMYAKGYSFRQIEKEKGIHPEETRRTIRKALNWVLEQEQDVEGLKLAKN